MISLSDGKITDLLPQNLVNEEVEALGYALNKAVNKIQDYALRTRIFSAIDDMPEHILDLLAQELNTMYYNQELDIDTKRIFIKNTLQWYFKAGTPAAVEELSKYAAGESRVREWFEMEDLKDEPYTFIIEAKEMISATKLKLLMEMIHRVKNTRSHLKYVEIMDRKANHKHMQGIGVVNHIKMSVEQGGD